MFTPSQVHRVSRCPVSETYPHIQRETEYSAAGTAAHKLYADVRELRAQARQAGKELPIEDARALALRHVEDAEQYAVLEALPLDDPRLPSLDPSAYTAELAMAMDVRAVTARILGKGLTREQARAAARPGEMVGITDLAAVAGKSGVVLDLKFGHGRVPRAAVNLQTDTYGLMLYLAQGLEDSHQGLVRVFGPDDVWADVVHRDSLELDDHLDRLRALVRQVEELQVRAPEERPAPVEGPWCTYCPAFLACPAKRALLLALAQDPDAALAAPDQGEMPGPEQLGEGWRRLRRAKQALERVEAIYKELARVAPIPLGDGEVLGVRRTESEGLVGHLAAKVLEEKVPIVGRAVVETARSEMTKASLARGLKQHLMPTLPRGPTGRPQPFAPVERDIWALLRENGATRDTIVDKVMEFTPKAPEGPK